MACPFNARAQSVTELEAMLSDSVVQTGSAQSGAASVAPATISTITAEDLRKYGFRTLDEAINFASMGMMAEYNMHSVEVGARGVLINGDYGNHVLLLVNGLALNEPWNGTAYFERGAGVPFEMIDRIEVMIGPGSVVYGSQAMLGTINIVTKDGFDNNGVHMVAEAEAISPLGVDGELRQPGSDDYISDLGNAYRVGLGYGNTFKLWGLDGDASLHGEYYRLNGAATEYRPQEWGEDWITGEPKQYAPNDPSGVWGGKQRSGWLGEAPVFYGRVRLNQVTLSARAGMYKRAAPYEDNLVRYFGDFEPPNDFERDRWVDVELQHHGQLSDRLALTTRAYVNYNLYEWFVTSSAPEDCDDGQLSGCRHDLNGYGRRYGLETKGTFEWRDGWRQATMLGVDGRIRDVDSRTIIRSTDGDSEPLGEISPVDTAGAAFLEHTARPTEFLDVNLGARLDADERFGTHLSPRVAAAFGVWSGGTLKSVYAEAFRAPSAYELYYEDPFAQLRTEDLQPETTRAIEASFEQRSGPHRMVVGAFRSWWDEMVLLPTLSEEEVQAAIDAGLIEEGVDEVGQYRNATRITNVGMNAGYGVSAFGGRMHFETNVTVARSIVDSDEYDPGRPTIAPSVFGNARISYDLRGRLPVLALASNFRNRRFADRYYDGEFSDPPVAPAAAEFKATVSGPFGSIDGLAYRLSANYVTAGLAPYAIGPVLYAEDEDSRADLQPINRLSAFVGLRYDFGSE